MSSFQISTYNFTQESTSVVLWIEYRLNASVGRVNCQFLAADGNVLSTQYVDLPEDIYSEWSTSDQVILDYVSAQLGFTFS